MKGNEKKRLYPVLPFPEDSEKNLNNLSVVDLIDPCFVSISKPRDNIQSVYIFLFWGSNRDGNLPLSLFLKIVFTFDKFQSFTGICKS
jgi:hypothetical protein